ncbi:putative type II secretion system protein F [bioreactor metagenome]|uniref:Putative type II secretion system protein F n=1 Tax=bioreactor metagenome TaxID=1076179 RepID=A0A645EWC7_9ZZZZ
MTGELQRFMEESRELKDFIVTSSIYPMVVLTITVVVMILMFTVFVPQFARTFANMGRELPGSMVFLMTLSTVMSYAVWLVPLGLISLWFGLRSYLGIDRLRELRAAAMLRIPVLGKLIVELEIGKFIRTLSILVSNHVDIIKTVRIATRVIQNPLIRKSFDDVEPRLRGGEKLSAALTGNPFVPPSLPSRLRVGEESGNSGLMLVRAAVYLEEGARRSIKRLLGLFEPMIIIVLALGIAIVVVSIFLAVMEMNSIPGS